ncbi:MAG: nucleoside deaminase [Marinilabiliaceae bacterium]
MVDNDDRWMAEALKEARLAEAEGEIPVGAVVVCRGLIVGRGHNQTERLADVTAHAEVLAITAAAQRLGAKYLNDCTLFVTLEPCVMCAGALAWAQVGRVVYGASEPKRGYARLAPSPLHPKTVVTSGVMAGEAAQLVRLFFKGRRG